MILAWFVIASMANIPAHFAAAARPDGDSAATSLRRAEQPVSTSDDKTRTRASEAYGELSLSFEANHGQTAPRVKFLSRGDGYNLFLTSNEAVLVMSKGAHGDALKIKLIGSNPEPRVAGERELPGKSNYLSGADPGRWRTNIANYARVKYDEVYPGVDLVYYGVGRELEYDFIVAAGADPGRIKLSTEGAQGMRLDERGDLVLSVGGGEIRQRKPVAYQEVNGVRKEVAARYTLSGKRRVGFSIAAYDKSKPLVIDPVLVYTTYLGGGSGDLAQGVAVDEDGSAYVTGQTASSNFPITAGALQTAFGGVIDAFVTKLNQDGSAPAYSTYLGGGSFEAGQGIAVDILGKAYVTGIVQSDNFPVTSDAPQGTIGGGQDAFVTKLNSDGSALGFSTYLGGRGGDTGEGIAVRAGEAYVAGITTSSDFPTTAGAFQRTNAGGLDGFVAKFGLRR